MKYETPLAKAAYLLSLDHAEATVGESSEVTVGRQYQALVAVSQGRMVRANVDKILHSPVPAGREVLVWIVEDEDGHIDVHRTADVDTAVKNVKDMRERFATLVAQYAKPIDWAAISDGFASVRSNNEEES